MPLFNTLRVVGAALGCDMIVPRDPWGDFDLLTSKGVRVFIHEVAVQTANAQIVGGELFSGRGIDTKKSWGDPL